MKLTPPTKFIFWLALIVGALALISNFVGIPFVTANKFWFAVAGWALLVLGTAFKGL